MRIKTLIFSLVFILCSSIVGCTKTTTLKNDVQTNLNNNIPTVTDVVNADNKSPKLENSEIFFGNWIITDVIAQGNIGIYNKTAMQSIIGTKLYYNADNFTFNDKIISNPKYEKTTVSKDDFSSTHFNVSLEALGVKAPNIIDITVTMDDKSIIDSIGSTFLILDNSTLVIYNGGVFFKAKKS